MNHLPQPNHPQSVTVAKILTSSTYINDTPLGRNTVPRHTGHFITFSVITNIYSKKTKEPTLNELFTATGDMAHMKINIKVLATHASTWVRLGMDHCSSEGY
jgi:hypothetical protein